MLTSRFEITVWQPRTQNLTQAGFFHNLFIIEFKRHAAICSESAHAGGINLPLQRKNTEPLGLRSNSDKHVRTMGNLVATSIGRLTLPQHAPPFTMNWERRGGNGENSGRTILP